MNCLSIDLSSSWECELKRSEVHKVDKCTVILIEVHLCTFIYTFTLCGALCGVESGEHSRNDEKNKRGIDSIRIEWMNSLRRMNVCDNDAIYSNWMGCECFNFCLLSFHLNRLKSCSITRFLFPFIRFYCLDFFSLRLAACPAPNPCSQLVIVTKIIDERNKHTNDTSTNTNISSCCSGSSTDGKKDQILYFTFVCGHAVICAPRNKCIVCMCYRFSAVPPPAAFDCWTHTRRASKSIRCPSLFLSFLLFLHVQCPQLRLILWEKTQQQQQHNITM